MRRQSGGGIDPRRVMRRVLFVLGGTVATTAAAWAISATGAAAATSSPAHPVTSAATRSLAEQGATAYAQAHPGNARGFHEGKIPQDVTNQILSTVRDVGNPLGKTAVTAVKDVASTADKTIRAATTSYAPIKIRPAPDRGNGENSGNKPKPNVPTRNPFPAVPTANTAQNTANAAANGVSTTVSHLGTGLTSTVDALDTHVKTMPMPPPVTKVTGVLLPSQNNKFDPVIMGPGAATGVISAAQPTGTTSAKATQGGRSAALGCATTGNAKHSTVSRSSLSSTHGLSRAEHHRFPPVNGPPAPDTIPANSGSTGGNSASSSSPMLDMPLSAGFERHVIGTIDAPADEVPPASTTHRPGCSPD